VHGCNQLHKLWVQGLSCAVRLCWKMLAAHHRAKPKVATFFLLASSPKGVHG